MRPRKGFGKDRRGNTTLLARITERLGIGLSIIPAVAANGLRNRGYGQVAIIDTTANQVVGAIPLPAVTKNTAGYLLHSALTHKYIFDVHDDDIFYTMELLPGADLARVFQHLVDSASSRSDAGQQVAQVSGAAASPFCHISPVS